MPADTGLYSVTYQVMDNSQDPFYSQPHHQPHPHGPSPAHVPATAAPPAGQIGPRSVEYVFLMIVLLTTAASLIFVLTTLVNGHLPGGSVDFNEIALPTAALIISLPVWAVLVWDTRRAELHNPRLLDDPYKKRSVQVIKILAFITCFFTLISLVYHIFTHATDPASGSLAELFYDAFVILAVAGGILSYYLVNERKRGW